MKECENLQGDLKAFLDGQLSPAARIAMRLHLNRCESCRKEIEEMRLLGTRMRTADGLEMSDALRTRILAAAPNTAPTAPVPMRPKWREKPVLVWGASASAVLAWFMLYPTLSKYQNHASGHTTASAGPVAGEHYYTGKPAVIPSWMTRSRIPSIGTGNGNPGTAHSPGDAAVVRQTELLKKMDPAQQLSTARGTLAPRQPLKFESLNGLGPLVQNGNALPSGVPKPEANIPNQLQVVQGDRVSPDAYKDSAVPPAAANLNVNQVNGTDVIDLQVQGGTVKSVDGPVRRYTFPRTVDLTAGRSVSVRNGEPDAMTHIGRLSGSPQALHDFADDLPTERQVHREATLTVEVANAEQQSESVERLVKESKGYVAQNQLTTAEDNTRTASLTCKIPVDQFDTVMGQIARLGLLKGKTLSGEDITEKVSDEQETGHVLRADIVTTEEKLKVRRRHADSVRDEETLRHLRIRMAQSQARLKMLTRLGTLSEITVELDEKLKTAPIVAPKPVSPFMDDVSGTGQAAAHSFLMALRLPVQLLVWIVVYSPLWALLLFAYRRMTR